MTSSAWRSTGSSSTGATDHAVNPVLGTRLGELVGALHRRHKGQGRFGALVEVHAVDVESVEGSSCGVVAHHDAGVVVTSEPAGSTAHALGPPSIMVQRVRPPAGVGDGSDLDRLLVELRSQVGRAASSDSGDREVPL